MGRSLIVVRAGRKSLHHAWIDRGQARDWDIYVCPYEEISDRSEPDQGIIVGRTIEGAKWTGLRNLFNHWGGWRDYDYVLLADDDLYASQSTWSNFFRVCSAFNARLAQPALTQDSKFSHLITMRNNSFMLRRVGFIEIMMPCFRIDILSKILPTFDLTRTGWGFGLDLLWSHLLSYQDLLIVDCAPVQHLRPVGIMRDDELGRRNTDELNFVQHHLGIRWVMNTFSGVDQQGREIRAENPAFSHQYITGYWNILKNDLGLFDEVIKNQHMVA